MLTLHCPSILLYQVRDYEIKELSMSSDFFPDSKMLVILFLIINKLSQCLMSDGTQWPFLRIVYFMYMYLYYCKNLPAALASNNIL